MCVDVGSLRLAVQYQVRRWHRIIRRTCANGPAFPTGVFDICWTVAAFSNGGLVDNVNDNTQTHSQSFPRGDTTRHRLQSHLLLHQLGWLSSRRWQVQTGGHRSGFVHPHHLRFRHPQSQWRNYASFRFLGRHWRIRAKSLRQSNSIKKEGYQGFDRSGWLERLTGQQVQPTG